MIARSVVKSYCGGTLLTAAFFAWAVSTGFSNVSVRGATMSDATRSPTLRSIDWGEKFGPQDRGHGDDQERSPRRPGGRPRARSGVRHPRRDGRACQAWRCPGGGQGRRHETAEDPTIGTAPGPRDSQPMTFPMSRGDEAPVVGMASVTRALSSSSVRAWEGTPRGSRSRPAPSARGPGGRPSRTRRRSRGAS